MSGRDIPERGPVRLFDPPTPGPARIRLSVGVA
jgi:hypothetical protein